MTDAQQSADNQAQAADNAPAFSIERIYVKDLSLENPNSPESFFLQAAPQVEIQLQTRSVPVQEALFETTVMLTVTAKSDDKTVFLVEVAQAGLFHIRNIPEEEIQPLLGIHCPNILFPYAREAVSDAVTRAGFPPVYLAPINFEALYAQQMADMAARGEQPTVGAPTLQ